MKLNGDKRKKVFIFFSSIIYWLAKMSPRLETNSLWWATAWTGLVTPHLDNAGRGGGNMTLLFYALFGLSTPVLLCCVCACFWGVCSECTMLYAFLLNKYV